MRKQFVKTIEAIFRKNKKIFLLLGDIGVFAFKNLINKEKNRAINIGILEQSTISFAAGMSKMGMIPVVHTIAPFITSRAFEQIKIDFGYQKLRGNFVTVGSSYDYSKLGCTHHCPEDVNLMKNIPGLQIVIPGSSYEFHQLFNQAYSNKSATYFRLSEYENKDKFHIKFGEAKLLQKGKGLTVIAIGPVLNLLKNFVKNYNINLLYLTTVRPLDEKKLKKICKNSDKIMIIEPYYTGSINSDISKILKKKINFVNISVPFDFIHNYGSKEENDKKIGFTEKNIENQIKKLISLKK